jgi:hypothetical protein
MFDILSFSTLRLVSSTSDIPLDFFSVVPIEEVSALREVPSAAMKAGEALNSLGYTVASS